MIVTESVPSVLEPLFADSMTGRQTLMVNHSTERIRKYGTHQEWRIMDAIGRNTRIPVPRVFTKGCDMATGQHWFEMENVRGVPLDEAWDHLSDENRLSVQTQLSEILDELRNIGTDIVPPSPLLTDAFFLPRCRDAENRYASVKTPAQFIDRLAATLERTASVYQPAWTTQVVRMLRNLPTDEPLVFTHGNLEPRNILLGEMDGHVYIAAIVDWAQAGYYPAYWEYVKAHFWEFDSDFVMDGGFEGVFRTTYPLALSVIFHAKGLIW